MKKNIINRCFLFIASLGLLTSCSIEDDSTAVIPFVPGEVQNPVTISQLIIANPNLTILEEALRIVESETDFPLITDLNVPGNSTIFAPSDEAFQQLLATNGITNISDIAADDLAEILQYHVIPVELSATDLSTGYVQTLGLNDDTDQNLSMYVDTTNGVVLNGQSTVVTPNVEGNNGVIHIVDAVINVPTIATFTGIDPNLSSFHDTTVSLGLRPIVGSTVSTRTAFVPNNTAFDAFAATLDLPAEGEEADPLVILNLARTLRLHVVPEDLSASELQKLSERNNPFSEETLLDDESLTFNVSSTVSEVDEEGNEILAFDAVTITDPLGNVANTDTDIDIHASNGTLHVITSVLQAEDETELPMEEAVE